MRSFQGNGVQGNRGGLGKQSLSLAKKGISCELQVRLPRLFQSALLRCRYEGLSPSGQSVKGVRNDSAEFTVMTTYCHSEERGKAP